MKTDSGSDPWRLLADLSPSMLAWWDRELRCQAANRACETGLGVTREQLMTCTLPELLGPARFALDEAHVRAVLRGEAQTFERVVPGPDGVNRHHLVKYVPHRVEGEIVGFVAEETEVTPPKDVQRLEGLVSTLEAQVRRARDAEESHVASARQAEARAEERFRRVVEEAPSGMLMVDARHVIVMVNRRTEELFGYSRAELIGQPLEILVPLRARAQHRVHVSRFVAAPTARLMGSRGELFGRARDGREIPIEIGLTLVDMVDGPYTLASIVDNTARKAAQDELKRSNAELEQFAYVASHDLQEPLRMVASYTELLSQRYHDQLDEKANKYIFYAVDGARRMQQLIKDLLAYSRLGSQGRTPEPVAVEPTVARVKAMLQPALTAAGGTLEVGPMPTVLADEGQLQQLFQNLIGNALKFRRPEVPLRITIDAHRELEQWVFSVRDNGIGFEPQYSERIFQMFQRLHERGRFEGSGIGLSIVKRIVERHHGRISVTSTPGEGSTFVFSLPAAGASADS